MTEIVQHRGPDDEGYLFSKDKFDLTPTNWGGDNTPEKLFRDSASGGLSGHISHRTHLIAEVAMGIAEVDAGGSVARPHLEREPISDHCLLAFADGLHKQTEVVERICFALHRRLWRADDAVEKGGGFVAFCGFLRPALDANYHPITNSAIHICCVTT